jgi:hypothetical protein
MKSLLPVSLRDWLGFSAPVLAILGLIAYVLVRVAYSIFYGPLGVSPDEVGLDYAESFYDAGVGIFLLAAVAGIVGIFLALVARRFFGRRWSETLNKRTWALAFVSVVILAGLANSTIIHSAQQLDAVEQGREVKPSPTFYVVPPVPIRAEPVAVVWIGSPKLDLNESLDCVMYLGRAEGIAVFYVPSDHKSLRLPSHSIAILSKGKASCPT